MLCIATMAKSPSLPEVKEESQSKNRSIKRYQLLAFFSFSGGFCYGSASKSLTTGERAHARHLWATQRSSAHWVCVSARKGRKTRKRNRIKASRRLRRWEVFCWGRLGFTLEVVVLSNCWEQGSGVISDRSSSFGSLVRRCEFQFINHWARLTAMWAHKQMCCPVPRSARFGRPLNGDGHGAWIQLKTKMKIDFAHICTRYTPSGLSSRCVRNPKKLTWIELVLVGAGSIFGQRFSE